MERRILAVKVALCTILTAQAVAYGTDVALVGAWHGAATCQQKDTACRDEKVVYHVAAPNTYSVVAVSADKIVGDQVVNMGTLQFHYNKAKQTLDCDDGPRSWHFQLEGRAMHGTLTVSGTLFRKVELTKD